MKKIKQKVDMVVLATGMQPEGSEFKVPGLKYAVDGLWLMLKVYTQRDVQRTQWM